MPRNRIKIIGVDCAVDSMKVGVAAGLLKNGHVRLLYPKPGPETKWAGAGVGEIVKWIEGDDPVLLAFDAPLGWPGALATGLAIPPSSFWCSWELVCYCASQYVMDTL